MSTPLHAGALRNILAFAHHSWRKQLTGGASYAKARLGLNLPRVIIALGVCSGRDLFLSVDKGLDVKIKAESVSFRNSAEVGTAAHFSVTPWTECVQRWTSRSSGW